MALASSTVLRVPSMLTATWRLFVGRQVVDRGQMVEMVDLALERLDHVGRHAQLLLGQVAEHRHHPRRTDAPELAQGLDLGFAFLADQEMHHRTLARKQLADQPLANESGRAGHEILHGYPLLILLKLPPGHSCRKTGRRHSAKTRQAARRRPA